MGLDRVMPPLNSIEHFLVDFFWDKLKPMIIYKLSIYIKIAQKVRSRAFGTKNYINIAMHMTEYSRNIS